MAIALLVRTGCRAEPLAGGKAHTPFNPGVLISTATAIQKFLRRRPPKR